MASPDSEFPMSQRAWTEGLRALVHSWRASNPMQPLDDVAPRLRQQVEVQGGTFASFVDDQLDVVLSERQSAGQVTGAHASPTIVWITDEPGMIAASLMLDPTAPHMVAVPEAVFEAWTEGQPDWDCRYHIEYISLFAGLDGDDSKHLTAAQRDSAVERSVHRTAIIWGEDAGHEARHLWRWDGDELVLEQQNFGGALVF